MALEGPAGALSPFLVRLRKRCGGGIGPFRVFVLSGSLIQVVPCSSPVLLLFIYVSKRLCNSSVKCCAGPMACQAASSDSRVSMLVAIGMFFALASLYETHLFIMVGKLSSLYVEIFHGLQFKDLTCERF